LDRTYSLFVPEGYAEGMTLPLVFNFHARGSSAEQQINFTRFNEVANEQNLIVCYPNAEGTSFNQSGVSGVDDFGFVDTLATLLQQRYNTEPAGIYATGLSNGAFFCYAMACAFNNRFQNSYDYDNRVTMVASVAGAISPLLIENFCDLSADEDLSVLVFHGTDDAIVPYEGNNDYASVPEVIDFWTGTMACTDDPVVDTLVDVNAADGSYPVRTQYTHCDADTEVVLYTLVGGNHTWPGGTQGGANQDVVASDLVGRFFVGQSLDDPTAPTDTTVPNVVLSTEEADPTNAAFFTATLDFSEVVTVPHLDDFALTNATVSELSSVDDSTFTVVVTPNGDGWVALTLIAESVQDAAGNKNVASNTLMLTADYTAPVVLLSGELPDPVDALIVSVNLDISESVDFTGEEVIALSNASVRRLTGFNDSTYVLQLISKGDGEVLVTVLANAFRDAAGNVNEVSNTFRVPVDLFPPTVELQTDFVDTVREDTFQITLHASEAIATPELDDFVVDNLVLSELSVLDDSTFQLMVNPERLGSFRIQLPAGVVEDGVGRPNVASNTLILYYMPSVTSLGAEAAPWQIYPNPVSETLNIKLTAAWERLILMDMAGNTLRQTQRTSTAPIQWQLGFLPPGMYVLQLSTSTNLYRTPLVKQ